MKDEEVPDQTGLLHRKSNAHTASFWPCVMAGPFFLGYSSDAQTVPLFEHGFVM